LISIGSRLKLKPFHFEFFTTTTTLQIFGKISPEKTRKFFGGISELSMDKQIRRFYDFGEFRLDAQNHRLIGENGETVLLTPREFELLLVLIRNADDVVTKDALLDAVWKDAFVAEETLTRNISFLRKKLGGEKFIETVPKIGYRFAARVQASDAAELVIEEQVLTRIRAEETISLLDDFISDTANIELRQSKSPAITDGAQYPESQILISKFFRLAIGIIGVVLIGFVLYQSYFQKREPKIVFASPAIPFSGLTGYESMPSFSPDSKQIAFAWNNDEGAILDIYVKIIGTGDPIRLTKGDRNAMFPVFTPDGKSIAFFRAYPEASKIYQVSALGGAERKIAEVQSGGTSFSFSPDGKTIAVADRDAGNAATGIYLVNVETGAKERLTAAPENFNDNSPRFSPDGKQVLFIRASGWDNQDLYIVPTADSAEAPRQLTFDRSSLSGLAWTANGEYVVFTSKRGGLSSNLWQIAGAGGEAELVMAGGKNPQTPAVAPDGKTFAYVEQAEDANIWKFEIGSTGKTSLPVKFLASSRNDHTPVFSPDDKKIAFVSDRTGESGIWVADVDGSNLMNLTVAGSGTPRFSPDGKYLAFTAKNAADANASIFVISVEGGAARRLTDDSAENSSPAWSPDGRWIYFRSNRGGDFQIWKTPWDSSGEAIQITRNGGFEMFAASDGKKIYYTKEPNTTGLWRVSATGGGESPVPELSEAGQRRYWTLTPNGIYYLARADHPPYKIMFYNFKTNQTKEILTTDKPPLLSYPGLSVSADGKMIFYAHQDQNASSIMLTKLEK
jgi:Tol biopolymer transport system component/DNA-binding winged helix-turn-helix (wHTH) protein